MWLTLIWTCVPYSSVIKNSCPVSFLSFGFVFAVATQSAERKKIVRIANFPLYSCICQVYINVNARYWLRTWIDARYWHEDMNRCQVLVEYMELLSHIFWLFVCVLLDFKFTFAFMAEIALKHFKMEDDNIGGREWGMTFPVMQLSFITTAAYSAVLIILFYLVFFK